MEIEKKLNNSGYTLVEISVALLIIFIVMGGVYQTIVRENVGFEQEEIILDMQNNARIALEKISKAVRGSGFMGCSGELLVNTLTNAGTNPNLLSDKTSADGSDADHTWDSSNNSIMAELKATGAVDWLADSIGFANNVTDAVPPHDYYKDGTDAITFGFLTEEVALANPMASTTAPVILVNKSFKQDDIILVTDCEDYSLFQKTNGDNTFSIAHDASGLNNDVDLGKEYGSTALARAFKLDFETFFIAFDPPLPDPDAIPILYRNQKGMPIASNIEDLQFEFYFDLDQDDDLTEPSGWQQSIAGVNFTGTAVPVTSKDVRAVRIHVLAQSEPVAGYTNRNIYTYPNSPYTGAGGPGDNRYRYLASTTIYIRNAGLIN